MGVLFIFIILSILVISALLFFNKGEKAQEIKSTLKDIYENFKGLFSNLKKLFLIITDLIKSKLDQEPTLLKDESNEDNSPKPASGSESKSSSTNEGESSSDDLKTESSDSQIEVTPDPGITPINEGESSSDDSMNNKNVDTKMNNF